MKKEKNILLFTYWFNAWKMSQKVSQNFAVFVPEKCHLSQKKIPKSPRMVPEKYGMYATSIYYHR